MRVLTQQFGSEYRKLMLAVYDAIAVYNYGRKATLDIFKNLNIFPVFYTNQMCQNMNIKRKYSAGNKDMDTTKKHREIIRYNKKKKGDKLVIKRVGTFGHYALVNHREIQYNTIQTW